MIVFWKCSDKSLCLHSHLHKLKSPLVMLHTCADYMTDRESTFWDAWFHIAWWREQNTHALRDNIIADQFRRAHLMNLCRRVMNQWFYSYPPPLVSSSSDESLPPLVEASSSDWSSESWEMLLCQCHWARYLCEKLRHVLKKFKKYFVQWKLLVIIPWCHKKGEGREFCIFRAI